MEKFSVGQLYIGKSKLNLTRDNYSLAKDKLIKHTFEEVQVTGKPYPDFYIDGFFFPKENNRFEIHKSGPHRLLVTGIPLSVFKVNDFINKDPKPIWRSYYQDQKRGYLFQIIEKPVNSNKLTTS